MTLRNPCSVWRCLYSRRRPSRSATRRRRRRPPSYLLPLRCCNNWRLNTCRLIFRSPICRPRRHSAKRWTYLHHWQTKTMTPFIFRQRPFIGSCCCCALPSAVPSPFISTISFNPSNCDCPASSRCRSQFIPPHRRRHRRQRFHIASPPPFPARHRLQTRTTMKLKGMS